MNEIPNFKFAIREDLKDTGDTFLPTRGTPRATGWDVKAAFTDRKSVTLEAGQHIKIPLGFRTFAPEGWWYELKPRSSTFGKKCLHSLYGTIDEDYEGQLLFACQYLPNLENAPPDYVGSSTGTYLLDGREASLLCVYRQNRYLTIDFGEAVGQIVPVKRREMTVENISNEEFESLCKNRNFERGSKGFGSTGK